MNEFPKRKHPRLKEYDYGENGAYFVTICTEGRKPILSHIAVGRVETLKDLLALSAKPPQVRLTKIGSIVEMYIRGMNTAYENVSVDKYVIMPNHLHLLITLADGGLRSSRPTIPTIVRSFKRMVTREVGTPIFQTSFYDHVVRGERDYWEIWQYIENNPARWAEDELYCNP